MKKFGKRDTIHREVRDVFRSCGWSWLDLADVGGDCPDALVCRRGVLKLLELKTGAAKLKPGQQQFAAEWPVIVIRSVDEARGLASETGRT